MIQLTELHILRYAIQKKITTKEEIEAAKAIAQEKGISLKKVLLERQSLTQSQWTNIFKEIQHSPSWPENASQRNLDNQMIAKALQSSGKLSPEGMAEAILLCQKLANPEHSPRLHEILVGKGWLKPAEVELYVGVERVRVMECMRCNFQVEVQQFFSWQQYPCPFCSGNLNKSNLTTLTSPSKSAYDTRALAAVAQDLSKQKFGRYEIQAKLGEGGMGAVYKAFDTLLRRVVALKVLHQQKDPSLLKRFYQEANLAAQLTHPGIIPLYEVGEEQGTAYFTMGFIEGETLRKYVEGKKKLGQKEALSIMIKLCRAVFYAHEQSVLHRDIKPDNVMIDASGEPHLMDFGLAKNVREKETSLTKTGSIVGSPEFMAPEQAYGEKQIGFPADIYALGGTLHFMLTGRPPFVAKDVISLLQKVVNESPTPVRSVNPLVQQDVETIILKCLAKQENERYAHAGLLLHDVQAVTEGKAILGQPPGFWAYARKMAARHKIAFATASFSLVALIVALFLWISALQGKMKTEQSLGALQKEEKRLKEAIEKKEKELKMQQKKMEEEREKLVQEKIDLVRDIEKYREEKNKLKETLEKFLESTEDSRLSRAVESCIIGVNNDLAQGNPLKALASLESILKLNHRQNLIYHRMASIYYDMKNLPKSYELWKKSEAAGPFPEQTHALVQVCLQTGKIEEAKRQIDFFIREQKFQGSPLKADMFYFQAKIFLHERNPQGALSSLEKAVDVVSTLKVNPERSIPSYLEMGKIYKQQRKFPKAIEAFRKALQTPSRAYGGLQNYARNQLQELEREFK